MNKGFFITGTDTGIGKTVVSTLLLRELRRRRCPAAYMKPVQTGCVLRHHEWVATDLLYCQQVAGPIDAPVEHLCPYRLKLPASPHLAAAKEGIEIDPGRIMASFHWLKARFEAVLVEGAGGLMVPLRQEFLIRDLMMMMNLPVIVVCRPGLGTLNHTLLTLAALQQADLEVAGLVMVDTENRAWTDIEQENRDYLAARVPWCVHLPFQTDLFSLSAADIDYEVLFQQYKL